MVVLVRVHIPHKYLIKRSKEALETVAIDGSKLQLRSGNYTSLTLTVFQKSQLSKVITCLVMFNFFCSFTSLENFSSVGFSWNNQVKHWAFFILSNNFFTNWVVFLLNYICNLWAFILIHRFQNWYCCQEGLILVAFVLSCVLYNVIECITVKFPQERICFCCNCSSTRCIVKKSQLSKSLTRFIGLKVGRFISCVKSFKTVKLTLFNDKKNCPSISLNNYIFSLLNMFFGHCTYYNFKLILV